METDRFVETGGDSHVQKPERPDCPPISRRGLLRALGFAPFALAAAVPGLLAPRAVRTIRVVRSLTEVPDEDPVLEAPDQKVESIERMSKMTDTAVGSFTKIFTAEGECVFFLDDNYAIVGGESFVKPSKRDFKRLRRKKQTPHKTYGAFLQAWFNDRRRELKAKNPGMDFSLKRGGELPEMTRGTGAVAEALKNGAPLIDDLLENFAAGLTQTDFAADYPGLVEHVSKLFVFGVAAHETKYRDLDNGRARGIWQFTPDTAKECGLSINEKKDERGSHVKSSRAAALCLNRMYLYLKKNSPVIGIMEDFSVPAEDFLVPCLVNAYHSGMGNVSMMLKWFRANYTRDSFEAEFGRAAWGGDLYFLMSKLYKNGGRSGTYGEDSRVYYLTVLAMRNALAAKDPAAEEAKSITPSEKPRETKYAESVSQQTTTKSNFTRAVLTALTSAVSVSVLSALGTILKKEPLTRRRFLTRSAALAVLCAGSTASGKALKEDEIVIENG